MLWITVTGTDGVPLTVQLDRVRTLRRISRENSTTVSFDNDHDVNCKETPEQILTLAKATMKI